MAGFKVVGEAEVPDVFGSAAPASVAEMGSTETAKRRDDTGAATKMLLLALKALSQRSLVALSNLFSLLTVASVWWLCMKTSTPDILDLVLIGMYALFVLAINFIIRR